VSSHFNQQGLGHGSSGRAFAYQVQGPSAAKKLHIHTCIFMYTYMFFIYLPLETFFAILVLHLSLWGTPLHYTLKAKHLGQIICLLRMRP
jgi:hypothetical protein